MSDPHNTTDPSAHGGVPPAPPTDPDARRAHDDIHRVLADFQLGLDSLKTLHEQRTELQARLLERDAELSARVEDLRARDEQLAIQQQDFERASARYAEQLRVLEASRAEHEAAEARLRAAVETHEQNARQQAAEADRARQAIASRAHELGELASRLERQGAELGEARTALAQREAEVARLMAELDLAATASIDGAGKVKLLAAEVERLGKDAAAARQIADEYEQLWGIERAASAGLAEALDTALAHIRDLQSAAAADKAGAAQHTARLAELDAALAQSRRDHDELERVLAQLQGRFKTELARFREQTEQAEARAAVAEAQAADLAKRPALPAARPADFTTRRRERLRRVREALRQRANRLKKGGEVLAKRFEQVEAASKQRAELAQIRDRVIAADRALQRSKARGRAAVTVLAVVGTITILGALSWAISRQVAPATFIAESVVQADGAGRELSPDELAEWLRFHQEALTDPRFQEEAAQRFARTGRADLGTPAAVAALLTDHLSTDSITPGTLTIHLTGQGRDNARRTLETLTAALASYANAAQSRRIDGGNTIVPRSASADGEPVDNTQTYYALGMLAGGLFACSVLGGLIWRKLANAKSAFEQDATLASVLDEARWAEATKI